MVDAALQAVPVRANPKVGLSEVINSIGESGFGSSLLSFINQKCGADHSAGFRLQADSLEEVIAASIDGTDTAHRQIGLYLNNQWWRRDPSIAKMGERLSEQDFALIHTDVTTISDNDLRHVVYGRTQVCDRVLICTRVQNSILALSILRSRASSAFSVEDLMQIEAAADVLLSLLNKHIDVALNKPNVSLALTSLADIQDCIAVSGENIPRREAEVSARIIYGVSSIGIATELGISEETVMTYRKRLYHRLGIATQRELLVWYLAAWSRYDERRRRH